MHMNKFDFIDLNNVHIETQNKSPDHYIISVTYMTFATT